MLMANMCGPRPSRDQMLYLSSLALHAVIAWSEVVRVSLCTERRSPGEPMFDGEQRVLRNPVACRIVWKRPRREDARVHMQAPLAQIPREKIGPASLEHEAQPPGPEDVDRALPMPVLDEVVQNAG